MIPSALIQAKKNDPKRVLDNIFQAAQTKGMPFTANDGQTYHMQARDKDRTNVTGLYLGARDFMTSGMMVQFTPYEKVKFVEIERDNFVNNIVPQYLQYFSLLHFTRKTLQEQIEAGNTPADIQVAFDQTLQTALEG